MNTGEQNISDYLSALSSKAPTPGGGGASALSAAMGVSLGLMVGSLTKGKPKYSSFEEKLAWIMNRLEKLQSEFLLLADEDEKAFLPLSKAYGMGQSTPEEIAIRESELEKCLLAATLVPIRLMEKTCDALNYMEELGEKGSRLALSDIGVGVQLLNAALNGAIMNVHINTKMMKDREKASELMNHASRLQEDGTHRAYAIFESVETALRPS